MQVYSKKRAKPRIPSCTFRALFEEASGLLAFATTINEQLTQNEDDVEVGGQHERHLEYVKTVAASKDLVEQYLQARANDAPSDVRSSSEQSHRGGDASESDGRTKEELHRAISEAERRVVVAQQQQEEIHREIAAAQQLQEQRHIEAEEAINNLR